MNKRFFKIFFIFVTIGVFLLGTDHVLTAQTPEKKTSPALPPARVEVVEVTRIPVLYRGYRESSTLETMEEVII